MHRQQSLGISTFKTLMEENEGQKEREVGGEGEKRGGEERKEEGREGERGEEGGREQA